MCSLRIAWLWIVLAGCSSARLEPADEASMPRAHAEETRGPKVLPVDGDPNGLWWDEPQQRLLVADDDGNRILEWTDARGFALVKQLPASSAKAPGLGQLVRTADGTIFVTRFGHGTNGGVMR